MANDADVKQLLLTVDATTELLRRNLDKAQAELVRFQQGAQRTLDATDRGFANLGHGLDRIAPAIARTNQQIGTIGATTRRIQLQVEASSAAISTALAQSAGALGAAFSAQKVAQYADSYTRFTNQLKVAGLEGQRLADTQQALFLQAQKNGAPLEALGTLYGRASQAGKALGASQADLLKFSATVSAALKVQGGSAEESKGALLQLGQALGTGKVRAEEFNSVNEGLRPVLQAAAEASDKYRGSVAAMKLDVDAGKLSSQEFFRLVLVGYDSLQAKAGKASLTIASSFTILNNALGKYIGETDAGLSATERFSAGVQSIAGHLDTILPALTAVAIGFGVTKAAGVGFGAVTGILAHVAEADREVARQVLLGNAQFIDRTALAARSAIATAEAAEAEVAAIEATIAARRADQASLTQSLALIEAQRLESLKAAEQQVFNSKLNFGLGRAVTSGDAARVNQDLKAQIVAKRAVAAVDAELVVAETSLAQAQARSAAASTAAGTATAATAVGARAAATASALFAGALKLVVGALPIIAIAALVAVVIHYRSEAQAASEETKRAGENTRLLSQHLAEAETRARGAAGGIAAVGGEAAKATGKMLAFAGAVGEAADNLLELAKNRRHEAVLKFTTDKANADQDIANIEARIASRRYATPAGATSNNPRADIEDRRLIEQKRRESQLAYQNAQREAAAPMESRLTQSERNGGRDIVGDLSRARNDLKIAQAGGDKTEINRLKAQVYELTQYQKYRKDGASDESAKARASSDAQRLRDAGQSKIDAAGAKSDSAAKKKADAEAAAAARKGAAEVKDEANDTRAYRAAERQAQDRIASANADLTNSAAARAQIERDRIEFDRQSRNEEIAQQGKAGRYTAERVQHLQKLNDQAAKADTALVDLKERRQVEADAVALANRRGEIEAEQLSVASRMATTIRQRLEKELRLLAIAKEKERRELDRVLAKDSGASEGDRQRAQLDKDTLDARYATKGAAVLADNAGAFEQFRLQLHVATDDMTEALDGVAVHGFQALEDGLAGVIDGTESAGSAFKKMASSIVADLARIAIEKAIVAAIDSVVPGGGSFFGAILGKRDGGRIEGRADGGRISGPGTSTSDSIFALIDGAKPLMVSNGESIVTAEATARYWPIIDAMNKGRLPGLARGGRVGPPAVFQPAAPDLKQIGTNMADRRDRLVLDANVNVNAGPEFEATMQSISLRTVGASAEPIMAGATSRTMRQLNRPSLPGGIG